MQSPSISARQVKINRYTTSQIQGGKLYNIFSLFGAEIYLSPLIIHTSGPGHEHFSDEAGDLLS